MEQKSSGSRIGACLSLVFLTGIAKLAFSAIYAAIFTLLEFLRFLPNFVRTALVYAFYPGVLVLIFVSASSLLRWASQCSERICATRKGLRYTILMVFELLCFLVNILSFFMGISEFHFSYLFSLLYAFIFFSLRG